MELKRTVLSAILAFAMIMPLGASAAAQEYLDFSIEQAEAVLPEVSVYVRGLENHGLNDMQFSATLGGEPLESVRSSDNVSLEEGICYLFLVDCSTSITNVQIDGIKSALTQFSNTLTEPEDMMLISFGESVEVLVKGGFESAEERLEAINSLKNDQKGTTLFDAISKTVGIAEAGHAFPPRRVIILFTDAEDFTVGSVTYDELSRQLSTESLPIYTVGFNTGIKKSLDELGVISRESGGEMLVTNYDEIQDNFDSVVSTIRSCVKLLFKTPTNEIDPNPRALSVTVSLDGQTATKETKIVTNAYKSDTEPPGIVKIERQSRNLLKLYFSEPVYGADIKENYAVTGNDAHYTVSQAVYIPDENAVSLSLSQELEAGAYEVSCVNITDRSNEKNLVRGVGGFTVEAPPPPPPEPPEKPNLIWIPLTIFLAVLGAAITAIVLISKSNEKKKTAAAEPANVFTPAPPVPKRAAVEPSHHFKASGAKTLDLLVSEANGASHKVKVKVDGSLFVGSSSMCNLYFDDPRLAQQHFVIEARQEGFFIQDLETAGGTFVNGVRLQGTRRLEDRDSIIAGQETFVYLK